MTIVLKILRQCLDVSQTAARACSFPICGFFNHFSFERKPFLAAFINYFFTINSGMAENDGWRPLSFVSTFADWSSTVCRKLN